MSTEYLLDPWFVQLKPSDNGLERYSRLAAIVRVLDLAQSYGLNLVRFLDGNFVSKFGYNRNYQRNDGRELGKLLSHLVIIDHHHAEANIIDTPCPHLPSDWKKALDQSGSENNRHHWRRPFIITSESRAGVWPHAEEIRFTTSNDRLPRKRNLICIEKYRQHPYCETDLDPWRLGVVGEIPIGTSGALRERRAARQCLPRPKNYLPLSLSFDQIVEELQKNIEWSCEQLGRAFYIPQKNWDPRTISQEEWRAGWRSGKIFPLKSVIGKFGNRESGPVDREGRVWLWDPEHNDHWDVQKPNGEYVNVSHEGLIRL